MCTGHMLVSWLMSSFNEQHNVCQRVSQRDLRIIAIQFCTHLLAANVIKKLEDESANPSTAIFKVSNHYQQDNPYSVLITLLTSLLCLCLGVIEKVHVVCW